MQADLLVACKPVSGAITVHLAIFALQACLVSPTRHLNPPSGNTKKSKICIQNASLKNRLAQVSEKNPTIMNESEKEPEKRKIKD